MKVYLLKVPKECYPRYSYTCKYAKTLLKRFKTILNALQINDDVEEPSFDDIKVYYLCQNSDEQPAVKDVCCRHGDKVEQTLLTKREFATTFGTSAWNNTDIFLAPYEYTKEAEKFMGPRRLFIRKGRQDNKSAMKKSNSTTLQELAYAIALLLEQVIIDALLERMGVLVCFMELKDATRELWQLGFGVGKAKQKRSAKSLNRSLSLDSASQFWFEAWLDSLKELISQHFRSVPPSFRDNIMAMLTTTKKELKHFPEKQILRDITHLQDPSVEGSDREVRRKVRHIKSIFNTIKEITQLEIKLERVKEQDEAIEQLYGEMQGIVYRSKISEVPHDAIEMNAVLEEEVARKVLSVHGVVSCGYRFRTLDIYLDDNISPKKRENATAKVRHILSRHGIKRHAFHCNQKELTLFRQVGASLTLGSTCGALGGFAKRCNEMCVLLAKHVAQVSPSVYIQNSHDSANLTLFAHVLPPRICIARSDIDIDMAKVVKNEQNNCDVLFKNEDGTGLSARLCTFNDLQWLHGLPVHIWRANSPPGLGIISHPILYRNGTSTKLVQIEDRQSEEGNKIERFAGRGESGAIVCADDPDDNNVHVIAMFIGSPNSSVAEQNPGIHQQYIAFRLVDGLDHLQHEQKAQITLY